MFAHAAPSNRTRVGGNKSISLSRALAAHLLPLLDSAWQVDLLASCAQLLYLRGGRLSGSTGFLFRFTSMESSQNHAKLGNSGDTTGCNHCSSASLLHRGGACTKISKVKSGTVILYFRTFIGGGGCFEFLYLHYNMYGFFYICF